MHDTVHPNVPLPEDAVEACDWEPPHVTGFSQDARFWNGRRQRVDAERAVTIVGTQWANGNVDRYIIASQSGLGGAWIDDEPITPQQARSRGLALIAAADDIEAAIETEWRR